MDYDWSSDLSQQIRTTYGVSIPQNSHFMAKFVKYSQAVAKYRMTMPTIISWNYVIKREASEATAMFKDKGVPSDSDEAIFVKRNKKGKMNLVALLHCKYLCCFFTG